MKRWMVLSLALAGGCDAGVAECVNATTGAEEKYVADALLVPMSRTDYALDLNGDGKADNQLGNIIGALTAQNLDTQAGVNESIAKGSVILLMKANADNLSESGCASTEIAVGKSMMNPDFSGNGTFMVDPGISGGTFKGKITGGTFNSNNPATTTTPVSVTITLPLVSGNDPVQLKITGGHIKYTRAGGKITGGQIHGAIKNDDVQMNIIPNVAKLLSDRIAADPNNSTNMTILNLFDTGGADEGCSGGCNNAAFVSKGEAACGTATDKKIQTCEVATNSIIKSVLSPDVQMFQNGAYKPNPANTMKDSLSLGLGFTAVKASF